MRGAGAGSFQEHRRVGKMHHRLTERKGAIRERASEKRPVEGECECSRVTASGTAADFLSKGNGRIETVIIRWTSTYQQSNSRILAFEVIDDDL